MGPGTESATAPPEATEASPEAAAPPAEPTPSAAETPAAPPAPAQPELPGDVEATFRLDEVPEEYREHVQRYVDTARPAITRAFQSAAEQRREAEQAVALYERLHSPDARLEALNELLGEHGLELDPEMLDPAAEGAHVPDGTGEVEPGSEETPVSDDPALQYLLERERQREAEAEESQESERLERMSSHVEDSLSRFVTDDRGGRELTPQEDRAIRAICLSHPLTDDGLPDIAAAIEEFKAVEAMSVQSYLKSREGVEPPSGGGPGVKKVDVSSARARLDAANAVAARHVP